MNQVLLDDVNVFALEELQVHVVVAQTPDCRIPAGQVLYRLSPVNPRSEVDIAVTKPR